MSATFEELPLAVNSALFALSAALVWAAGTRVARYADIIIERTGIGEIVIGMVLIAMVTSLPEVAVAVSASVAGNPVLAVNDLIGSAAINIVILAIADAAIRRDALTSVLGNPVVMLQGSFCVLLLAITCCAIVVGDRAVLGIGMWAYALVGIYLLALRVIARERSSGAWVASKRGALRTAGVADNASEGRYELQSTTPVLARLAVAGAVIAVAGFLLSMNGEAIAQKTGLGTSFVGAVLVGASTSLPEVSTVLEAMRLRRYAMAVSDVFGTNLANVSIIFVADALSAGQPVLSRVGDFAVFGALLAIVLTAIYLVGLLERRQETIWRLGIDSTAVLAVYAGGVFLLYQLR